MVSLSWEEAPALGLTLTSPEIQAISLTLSGAQAFFYCSLKVPFSSDILLFEQRRYCVHRDGFSEADPWLTLMLYIEIVELLAN